MICKNCGAAIDDEILLCPYCGAENEKIAEKQQNDEVQKYKKQAKEVKTLPEKISKMAASGVGKIVIAVILLFVLIAIVVWFVTYNKASNSLDKQKKHIKKLEKYCESGDYDKLGPYLDKIENSYSATYEKYTRISRTYNSYKSDLEIAKQLKGLFVSELDESTAIRIISSDIHYIISSVSEIQKMEEEGYIYGEGPHIEKFKEKYNNLIKDYMYLTQDEVKECISAYREAKNSNTTPDYFEYAGKVIERAEKNK